MSLNQIIQNQKKPWLNARVNNLTVDGNSTYSGNAVINHLEVTGNAVFDQNVTATHLEVTGNGAVDQNLTVGGNLTVTTNSTMNGYLSLAGNLLMPNGIGTYTPTVEGFSVAGTQTYSLQVGRYSRIGNVVTVWATVRMSSSGFGASGAMCFNLPYPATTSIVGYTAAANIVNETQALVLPSGCSYIYGVITNNGTKCVIYGGGTSTVSQPVLIQDQTISNTYLTMFATYITDASF